MKVSMILYLFFFFCTIGCQQPSTEEEKTGQAKFSSNGYMVFGNILIADLGKSIYRVKKPEHPKKEMTTDREVEEIQDMKN